jgi:hypothetical protein
LHLTGLLVVRQSYGLALQLGHLKGKNDPTCSLETVPQPAPDARSFAR